MLIKLARNLTGGKSPQPIDNAREYSLPRLYEQGASKRRIGLYLARWLGWAACACVPLSHATLCPTPPTIDNASPGSSYLVCEYSTAYLQRTTSNGTLLYSTKLLSCQSASDTVCAPPSDNNSQGTHYFKNTHGGSNDYISAYWTPNVGYSNPQNYTPTPTPTPVPFAPTALLFALFASLGSFFAYRLNRNKSQKGN